MPNKNVKFQHKLKTVIEVAGVTLRWEI